jgi:hypothetical protein
MLTANAMPPDIATFVYRCPVTQQHVQSWVADDGDTEDDGLRAITCLECGRVHIVDPKISKVLGSDEV